MPSIDIAPFFSHLFDQPSGISVIPLSHIECFRGDASWRLPLSQACRLLFTSFPFILPNEVMHGQSSGITSQSCLSRIRGIGDATNFPRRVKDALDSEICTMSHVAPLPPFRAQIRSHTHFQSEGKCHAAYDSTSNF